MAEVTVEQKREEWRPKICPLLSKGFDYKMCIPDCEWYIPNKGCAVVEIALWMPQLRDAMPQGW
jgi:hypothetical protein